MFDFGTLVTDVVKQAAPSLVSAGVKAIGNSITGGNRSSDTAAYTGDLQAQADVLKQGYDDQLGQVQTGFDEILKNLDAGYQNTTDVLDKSGAEYAGGLRKATANYATLLYPQLQRLAESLSSSDDEYEQNLLALEQEMASQLGLGQDEFEAALQPYRDSGEKSLQYLTAILGQNPDEFTPSQQRLVSKTRDDMQANLAASGLRGAGRAGVGVMNNGMAELEAQLFDQNQKRMDNAAQVLNTQGYNATNRVADSVKSLAQQLAELRGKTGGTIADARRGTATNIATTGYNLGRDVAGKQLSAEGDIASQNLSLGKSVADLTNKYFANKGDITGNLYQARGDTALNKAKAQAATGTNIAVANANTNNTNTSADNSLIGTISGQLANAAGAAVKSAIPGQRITSSWVDPDTGKTVYY